MASRASVNKTEDVEEQSISLLQSDAEAVVRDFSLRLTVLDIIEEGHKAAAMAIFSSVVIGFVLGISLPVDQNIPGDSLRLFLCSLVYCMQTYKHSILLEGMYLLECAAPLEEGRGEEPRNPFTSDWHQAYQDELQV